MKSGFQRQHLSHTYCATVLNQHTPIPTTCIQPLPKTSCWLPRPTKPFILLSVIVYKVWVEPQPPGSKLQASPSHHSMAAPQSSLSYLKELSTDGFPRETCRYIGLAGKLWGGFSGCQNNYLSHQTIGCGEKQSFITP